MKIHYHVRTNRMLRTPLWVGILLFILPVAAQTNGINESYALLGINGSNVTLDMQASTSFNDLEGLNLGSFTMGTSNSLVVRGGFLRTFKCNGGTVTATRFRWRVWPTADGPSGTFNTISLGSPTNEPGGCGGNQVWQGTSGTVDLVDTLLPGSYTFEAYAEADGTPASVLSNNGGANYKATFTLVASGAQPVIAKGSTVNSYTCFANMGQVATAISLGALTGNISVYVAGNCNETTSVVIPASGSGAANYTSITIKPYGGFGRIISGNLVGPLISLNGADYVTFDGVNTGGNSLTIQNGSASGSMLTSTIRFSNDAEHNTITRCTILGSSTVAPDIEGGTICFSTASSGGNDFNTVSNCNIGPAGSNLPTKGIYANGTPAFSGHNNDILIENNNIYNFFSPTVDSSGLYIGGGCNTWTINGNRFYQTASRAFIGAAVHTPLNLAPNSSAIFGMTVTNNIIGYSSANQTGTYTLSGGQGKFIGIDYACALSAFSASTVSNNTVARISLTGVSSSGAGASTPFAGIKIDGGNCTVNNNLVGSMTSTGSLVFSTSTTTKTEMFGILRAGHETITTNGNQIGAITVSNSATSGIFSFTALLGASSATNVNWYADANTIGGTSANSIQNNSTSSQAQVRGMGGFADLHSITGNTIRNLTGVGGTAGGPEESVCGIYCQNAGNQLISRNTIFNLSNSNTSQGVRVGGIIFHGATGNVVERNFIHTLKSSSSHQNTQVEGIFVMDGTTTFRNNMIALGAGLTNPVNVFGIYEQSGTNAYHHNSVYISGSVSSGAVFSSDMMIEGQSGTRDLRNNIFTNVRTTQAGTSLNYAVYVQSATLGSPALTMDYNHYYTSGNRTYQGNKGGLTLETLTSWKTVMAQDGNSVSGDPQFVAPTATTPNLHLKTTAATYAERRGIASSVADDFDGDVRSGLTPVDIGADAGLFMAVDTAAPVIAYTPLTDGITGNSTRTVDSVTITDDFTGVAQASGTKPRLYYKKATQANNAGNWKYVEASAANPYSFTLSYSAVGGVLAGDVIQYFIVAQDQQSPPNISINSGTFASPPASVNLGSAQFPIGGTINSFTVKPVINGNKTVCPSGCDFTSLTNEGGAFQTLNNSTLASSMFISILADLTNETGTYQLNPFNNPYSIVIRPLLAPRTISGSKAGALIGFNGADRVTIQGSLQGISNSVCPVSVPTRDLTIINTYSGATPSAVVWFQSNGTDGASGNAVKNCVLMGSGSTGTFAGAGSGSPTIGETSNGSNNDGNSFVNNDIRKVQVGIYSAGESSSNRNTGTVISQNLLEASNPNHIGLAGIMVLNDEGATVSSNRIAHIRNSTLGKAFGISMGMRSTDANESATAYWDTAAATVNGNMISDVEYSGASGAYGIVMARTTASGAAAAIVSNNGVAGVYAGGAAGNPAVGIYAGGGASVTHLLHNTVYLSGNQASYHSFGIFAGGTDALVKLRNSLIINKSVPTSGGAAFALGVTSASLSLFDSNRNGFALINDSHHFMAGTVSLTAPTGLSLDSWKSSAGRDLSSFMIDPVFVSTTDVRLATSATNVPLGNAGEDLQSLVPTDIDCVARDTTPTLGINEISTENCSGANGGTAVATSSVFCFGNTTGATLSATGYSTGLNITYLWQASSDPSFSTPFPLGTESLTYSNFVIPAPGANGYFRLAVRCAATNTIGYSNVLHLVMVPGVNIGVSPSGASICGGGSVQLTASGGDTYNWSPSVGLTATSGATVAANPTVSTRYTLVGTNNGCPGNNAYVLVKVGSPMAAPSVSSNSPICSGSKLQLNGTAGAYSPYHAIQYSGVEFVDIRSTGTSVGTVSDESEHNISFPAFTFNGVTYTAGRISNNGVLVFGTTTGDVIGTNSALPQGVAASATASSGLIANGTSLAAVCANWDNLKPTATGAIHTATVGNRFIIQWSNETLSDVAGLGDVTFQIQLNMDTGEIHVVYLDMDYGSTSANGGIRATIGLNFSASSALQYSFNTASVTAGQSITFQPVTVSYNWTGPNGFTSNQQNPAIDAATTAASGTYNLTVTNNASGCSSTQTTTVVTVNAAPNLSVTPSGPVCGGTSTVLTASGAVSYSWSPAAGLSSITGASVTANPTVTTVYTVTGVAANGCSSSRKITVYPTAPGVASSDSPRCAGETLHLAAPSGGSSGYLLDGYSNVSFIDIESGGTPVTGTPSGNSTHAITIPAFVFNGNTYTDARVVNDGVIVFGAAGGDVPYTNSALPQGIAGSVDATSGLITGTGNSLAAICANWDDLEVASGVTSIKTQTVGGVFIIQWTNEKSKAFPTAGNLTFQVQLEVATGKIHIVYKDLSLDNGLGSGLTSTIGLNFSDSSALSYSFNTASIADGQSLTFLPNTVQYSWTGPNGFSSNLQNPEIPGLTGSESGLYSVTVSNTGSGCSTTSSVPVTVQSVAAGGSISGGGVICFGTKAPLLTLSGFTGEVVRWESSNPPYTDWTIIDNTTTTLDPGTIYDATHYRAFVQAGCGTAYSSEASFYFVTTVWNGSWSNGVPDATKSVIFSADFTATSDITACEVIVDSGATVLFPSVEPDGETPGSGFDLNAQATVLVAAGKIIFEQGSNLVQKTFTGVNSGDIRMKTNVKLWRQDYVYWSSPVAQNPFAFEFDSEGQMVMITQGNTLRSFSPATLSQRFYRFDPVGNAFIAQFGAAEAIGIQNPASYTFEPGVGYMVRAPNDFPNPPATVGTPPTTLFSSQFVGVPQNGTITVPIPNGLSKAQLIGNPYPSPVRADIAAGFLSVNPGTLYFWTHHTQTPGGANYAMYNGFGGTAAYPGGMEPNGTIQVGQGFIFLNDTDLPQVTFTNDMRVGNNDGQFFGSAANADRMWLGITNGSVTGNEILIGYTDQATAGIDVGLDGRLLPGGNCLSSLIGAERFGIQARPAFEVEDVVPLGLHVETAGVLTISLGRVEGLFSDSQDIFLKDNDTGIVTNLKQQSYSFISETGDFDGRLQLQYVNTTLDTPNFGSTTVLIYKDENNIVTLMATEPLIASVRVFDVRGRLLYATSDVDPIKTRLTGLKAEHQMLLAQVTMEDGRVITKKVAY